MKQKKNLIINPLVKQKKNLFLNLSKICSLPNSLLQIRVHSIKIWRCDETQNSKNRFSAMKFYSSLPLKMESAYRDCAALFAPTPKSDITLLELAASMDAPTVM